MKNILFKTLCICAFSTLILPHNFDQINDRDTLYLCSGHESIESEQTPNIINDFILPDFPILPPDNPFPPIVPTIENYYSTNKEFTVDYFSNLKSNILNNVLGNCGLTAISMLLGYYDTYWNDDIILPQYDEVGILVNNNLNNNGSPGVKDSTTFSFSSNNLADYEKITERDNFITEKILQKDTDFFGLMLYYARLNGIYDSQDTDSDNTNLGIGYDGMVAILDTYLLYNEVLSSCSTLQHNKVGNFLNQDEMRNYIISLVEQGQPVIIGGNGQKNGKSYAHICVAYDYDPINDILIGNGGWGSGSFDLNGERLYNLTLNLDSYFNTKIADFYYIDIADDVVHNHPRNYFNYTNNQYICSCELETHNHKYNYVTHDTLDHYRKCFCMLLSEKNSHFFTHTIFKGGNEYSVCGGCGYSVLSSLVPQPGV